MSYSFMKRFDLLTLFPQFFDSYLSHSLVGKALEKKLFEVGVYHLRDWAKDRHRSVDDVPYGGGDGMVFRPEPLIEAIEEIRMPAPRARVIYLSCRGKLFNQKIAYEMNEKYDQILFVCGRYEGIDERVIESVVDEEISIGDYVLAGGEVAAMAVMDAVIRLIPGVMGKAGSLKEESFEGGLLEYPHYTRPEVYRGMRVPPVLLSGNHEEIRKWRLEQSIKKTLQVRPDLMEKRSKV